MAYILGLDGGGTKTVCLLMDDRDRLLSRGVGEGSNYHNVGVEAAKGAIAQAIRCCITAYTPERLRIGAIALGLAGVGRAADRLVIVEIVAQLQQDASLPILWDILPENMIITHDAAIALVGGLGSPVGIVAIAGTGSLIFGQNQLGETRRVWGWGARVGDPGSAYSIAVSGLKAVLKARDGLGEATQLETLFQEALQLENSDDLLRVLYQNYQDPSAIAALAPLIDLAAINGDAIAISILQAAIQDFFKATLIVKAQLFSLEKVVSVVTIGSVWQGKAGIRQQFIAQLQQQTPSIQVVEPCHEAAYGAGLLALASLGKKAIAVYGIVPIKLDVYL
uniref:N-acetylglucosamine kinase n=1 Tax=Desertifilum tharense IPPAS B-1220 TaxID=1781255 RepID=A0ACD5GS13_9CYAN